MALETRGQYVYVLTIWLTVELNTKVVNFSSWYTLQFLELG
jgi:hypothetical protein